MIIHRKKKYQIIGTPKSIGQTKIVGDLILEKHIDKICVEGQNVAVVLGRRSFSAVLYSFQQMLMR
jgi:hypothetical protein